MKRGVNIAAVVRIVGALYPAIRSFVRSVGKASDGGKRITPAEADEILGAFIAAVVRVAEDEVGPLVDLD